MNSPATLNASRNKQQREQQQQPQQTNSKPQNQSNLLRDPVQSVQSQSQPQPQQREIPVSYSRRNIPISEQNPSSVQTSIVTECLPSQVNQDAYGHPVSSGSCSGQQIAYGNQLQAPSVGSTSNNQTAVGSWGCQTMGPGSVPPIVSVGPGSVSGHGCSGGSWFGVVVTHLCGMLITFLRRSLMYSIFSLIVISKSSIHLKKSTNEKFMFCFRLLRKMLIL